MAIPVTNRNQGWQAHPFLKYNTAGAGKDVDSARISYNLIEFQLYKALVLSYNICSQRIFERV